MRIDAPICAQDTMRDLGALTINNVLMHIDGAWNVLNPQILWLPTEQRGSNVIISHARGRRAYPWRNDEGTYSMQFVIDGVLDANGDPYDNPWVGLEENTEYLYQNVFLPPTAPTATYDAELEMPSGAIRVATVQPKMPMPLNGTGTATFITSFTLKVLEGRFEPESS